MTQMMPDLKRRARALAPIMREFGADPETFPMGLCMSDAEASTILAALEVVADSRLPKEERERKWAEQEALESIFGRPKAPPYPSRNSRRRARRATK